MKTQVFENHSPRSQQTTTVTHHRCHSFAHIQDNQVAKMHAVCHYNGKLLVVHHSRWNIWGAPGGTREEGEPIEQTLAREIEEEAFCKIKSAQPLCYQQIKGDIHLIYLCEVTPMGEFSGDPAGNIDKIAWVAPNEVFEWVEDKEFRQAVWHDAVAQLNSSPIST